MRMKNYRIISLLLVIFVALSGMCFEDTKADSYFAYVSMEDNSFNFISDETEISDTHPCTSEMLGVRNNAGIQRLASQYLNQKRQNRISYNFLFLDIFSLSERIKKFFISSEATQVYNQCQEELVANYIHKSDGKKRI